MIKKVLFVSSFSLIGVLAYGWWINHNAIVKQNDDLLMAFINKGARFTADDGQKLCLRVKALEEHSYGYADSGLKPFDCKYK